MLIPPRVIVLTSDPGRRAALERKFAEYEKRRGSKAPELDPLLTYKLMTLGTLLGSGRVDVDVLRSEMRQVSWYDRDAFDDAVGVIACYNSGDTQHLRGGTGLK